jgi:hypothetical protein
MNEKVWTIAEPYKADNSYFENSYLDMTDIMNIPNFLPTSVKST